MLFAWQIHRKIELSYVTSLRNGNGTCCQQTQICLLLIEVYDLRKRLPVYIDQPEVFSLTQVAS